MNIDPAKTRRESMRWLVLLTLNTSRPIDPHEAVVLSTVQGMYPDATALELRRELANNSPMAIIQRHGTRAAGSRGIYEGDPIPDRLDRLQKGNPGGNP